MKFLLSIILFLLSFSARAATLGQVQVTTTANPLTNYLVLILGSASNSSYRLISPSNLSLILPTSGAGGGTGISTNGGSGTNNIFTAPVILLAVVVEATNATIRGGLTNIALAGTGTRVVLIDANGKVTAGPENSIGALTNNGSGAYGYFDLAGISGGGGGGGIATNGGSGTGNVFATAILISPASTNATLNGTNTGKIIRLSDLVVTNHSALGTANFTGPVTNTDTLATAGVASFQDSILVTGSSTFFSLLSVGAQLTAQDTIIAGGLVRVPRLIATNDVTAGVLVPLLATANRPALIGADGTVTNASGTPDGTKFVRDDGVLAVPGVAGGGTALPFITRFKTNGTMTINTNFYIHEYGGATNVTWTLPLASTCSNFTFVVKNNGTANANITLSCSGSDAFNGPGGNTTASVPPPKSASAMYSDGVNGWMFY